MYQTLRRQKINYELLDFLTAYWTSSHGAICFLNNITTLFSTHTLLEDYTSIQNRTCHSIFSEPAPIFTDPVTQLKPPVKKCLWFSDVISASCFYSIDPLFLHVLLQECSPFHQHLSTSLLTFGLFILSAHPRELFLCIVLIKSVSAKDFQFIRTDYGRRPEIFGFLDSQSPC